MKEDEIYQKLLVMIDDIKGDIKVDKNTALIEDQVMDSLELINYLTQIEEVFDINISMDELIDKKLGIIQNMINYLHTKSE